jgi:hypothetical protein
VDCQQVQHIWCEPVICNSTENVWPVLVKSLLAVAVNVQKSTIIIILFSLTSQSGTMEIQRKDQEHYATVIGARVLLIIYLLLFKFRLIIFFLSTNYGF